LGGGGTFDPVAPIGAFGGGLWPLGASLGASFLASLAGSFLSPAVFGSDLASFLSPAGFLSPGLV
jgi:hypothetical protein